MKKAIAILKGYWNDKKFRWNNLIIWFIIYLLMVLSGIAYNGFKLKILVSPLEFIALYGFFFYFIFFIWETLFEKNKRKFFIYFCFSLILYILFFIVDEYLENGELKKQLIRTNQLNKSNISLSGYYILVFVRSLIIYIVVTGLAIGYWAYRNNTKKQKKYIELEKQKEILQKQFLNSELNFLRSQINPHFLQNSLNFIYSDTRKTNPKAAEAVLLLSDIMRYSVADNTANKGMALLADETEQIKNVIQIQQLRFEHKLQIHFNIEGNPVDKQITPMILLTLVENLIKYGDLNDANYPATIDCIIMEEEKKIQFNTVNRKAYLTDNKSTGLGHKNIEERLRLIWGDDFSLQKEETSYIYKIGLEMPFKTVEG